jgi:hypothetical protein
VSQRLLQHWMHITSSGCHMLRAEHDTSLAAHQSTIENLHHRLQGCVVAIGFLFYTSSFGRCSYLLLADPPNRVHVINVNQHSTRNGMSINHWPANRLLFPAPHLILVSPSTSTICTLLSSLLVKKITLSTTPQWYFK